MSSITAPNSEALPQHSELPLKGSRILVPLSRRRAVGAILGLLGIWGLWAFALNVPAHQHASLGLNEYHSIHLAPLYLNVRTTDLILCLVTIVCAGLLFLPSAGRRMYLIISIGAGTLSFALITWAARGGTLSLTSILATTFVQAVPLVFGSLAGVMGEKSGVVNIAIEGQFLAGAFLGAMIGSWVQVSEGFSGHEALFVGLIAGAVAGGLMGALLAFLSLRYKADQVIVGVVIVTFATGMTNYLSEQVLNNHQNALNSPHVAGLISIPGLDRIPIVGPVIFNQNIFFYLAIALLVVIQVALSKTRWGLRVRAVGEHPDAAASVGLSVVAIRYRNVILGGAIGGLGGAWFTLGSVGSFNQEMTSGLGYVALAVMIFGNWRPLVAAGACLLFGFTLSLQNALGLAQTPIPTDVLAMFPYIVTIGVVAGLVGKVRPPAADGIPWEPE